MSENHPRPEGCRDCKKRCAVFYTGIIDGKAGKVAMCADCPTAKAMVDPEKFGLLSSLPGVPPPPAPLPPPPVYERCPVCGYTPIEFKKHNRFGCPHCYEHMDRFVNALIQALQPDDTHHGKRPATHDEAAAAEHLAIMKTRLHEAVKQERFEDAAKLRDRIRDAEARRDESAP